MMLVTEHVVAGKRGDRGVAPGAVAVVMGANGSGPTPPPNPNPPPINTYTRWFSSRQLNLTPPYLPNNSDPVTTWSDLSNTGDELNPVTDASWHTNQLASLPIVSITGGVGVGSIAWGPAEFTLFITFSMPFGGIGDGILFTIGDIDGNASHGLAFGVKTGNFVFVDGNNGVTNIKVADPGFHILAVQCDGTFVRAFLDGAISSFVNAVSLSSDVFVLGAGGGLTIGSATSEIFEIVTYDSTLSITDINTVGSWYGGVGTGAPATDLTWTVYTQDGNYWPGLLEEINADAFPGSDGSSLTILSATTGQNATGSGAVLKKAIVNGHAVARFSGAGTFVTTGPSLEQPYCFFTVASNTGSNTDDTAILEGSGVTSSSSNRALCGYKVSSGNMAMYMGSGTVSSGPSVLLGFNTLGYYVNGASSIFSLNGIESSGSTNPGTDGTTSLTIGSNVDAAHCLLFGDVSILLIWDASTWGSTASTIRSQIAAWLKSLYATP